jgi:hypothetical protein
MASDLDNVPLRAAQPSTASIIDRGSLKATSGFLPVAGRPRRRFLDIIFIDFLIMFFVIPKL